MNDNIDEIIKTVHAVAEEKESHIPNELFSKIIKIQFEYGDNPSKAKSLIQKEIENYVNSVNCFEVVPDDAN